MFGFQGILKYLNNRMFFGSVIEVFCSVIEVFGYRGIRLSRVRLSRVRYRKWVFGISITERSVIEVVLHIYFRHRQVTTYDSVICITNGSHLLYGHFAGTCFKYSHTHIHGLVI